MRETVARIHYQFFMIEESVSVYMFQKDVQSRRSRTLFLKTSPCNARTRFSYPPPAFYDWGECVRVYVLKGSSVQAVPHPIFENVTVQCKNTCFVSTTCFLWLGRVCESICFQRWFSPDSPASIFWKRDRAMREHVCRSHHLFFMSEESVSVYMF